ncbi:MAG: FAD-dependent oxidoreductase [Gemmatimonadetes bacterium]|nr:FAD-dependent oxidoreductase [Gemmatimonadota bacterium]
MPPVTARGLHRTSRLGAQAQPRIAVIGGGAAGLTAAHTLKQLGYVNVTVYERAAEPGGKVLTYRAAGSPVELGAVFTTSRCETTLELAREVGAPMLPMQAKVAILDDDGTLVTARNLVARKHGVIARRLALWRFFSLLAKYRTRFERRGFAGLPPELNAPFAEFAARKRLLPLAEIVRYQSVAGGYGYYDTVPALYFMKGLGMTYSSQRFLFPLGYQDLWARVAQHLDVRCSAEVTAVRRQAGSEGHPVLVEVNGTEEAFDHLILATPCEATARFLDLTGEEQDLFGHVVRRNFQVTVARVEGVPHDHSMVYLYSNTKPARAGHVACWFRPTEERTIFAAYQLLGAAQSDAEARRLLKEDFRAQGGTVTEVLSHRTWDNYFEHVETPALNRGFYERFEALQGKNATHFATGLIALEGVETCARYARDLMREAFAPVTT